MDEETDIGTVNLSRPSLAGTPTTSRPPSIARAFSLGMKSPSSPNLLPIRPKPPTRRNTNPRKLSVSIQPANLSLDGLSMEQDKIASLRRWIISLAVAEVYVVDFDLEVGPKISCVYPPLDLSPSEEVNISFSAFPDSPQFEQGSQTHSFRIRVRNPVEDKLLRSSDRRPQTEDGFLYGFSQFTQRRDATSKRGYQQRSVVILTHLAYPALFYTLVEKLGPAVLAHGGPMLEAACHNIATWLDPSPGATLELGFLGCAFLVELPAGVDTQQALPSSALSRKNARRDAEYPLWSIWECLVLCEPILVYGPSPAMTSQAIWWLRDILRPIPVAGDFRPFFTIHDADHTALVNPRPPSTGLILAQSQTQIRLQVPPRAGKPSTVEREASALMRQHFSSRTAALLVPLQRYLQSLIPLPSSTSSTFPSPSPSSAFPRFATHSGFPKSSASSMFPKSAALGTFSKLSASSLFPPTPLPGTFPNTSSSSGFSTPEESPWAAPSRSASPSPKQTPPTSQGVVRTAAVPPALNLTPRGASASGSESSSEPSSALPSGASTYYTPLSTASNLYAPLGTGSPASSATLTPATPRLAPFSEKAFLASLKPLALPFKSSGKAKEFYGRWIRSPAFGVWIGRQEEAVERVLASARAGGPQ
ncbi:hypothetical protein FOMPIDRAFT_1013359 [Fomitopsis schrenkii]|uniref:UDENN domain-containing protein n=1 Tax=Fomitopsis schrenkii TaxID=2126942 RepID=S8EKI6_FOMSC|nr:hypothetical protein FOMPIDRAFT_1013359 [Fomitopsis schrenkii]